VWHEWREGGFNVAVGAGDIKARHIERDARVSISIAEDTPPYRGIEVRGQATISKEETQEILRRITVRYLGPEQGESYANMMTQADLTLIRIEPGVLRAWDFADEPELAG
jgi:general stress protein 26